MPARIRKLILSQQLEIAQICHVGGAAGGLQLYPETILLTGGGRLAIIEPPPPVPQRRPPHPRADSKSGTSALVGAASMGIGLQVASCPVPEAAFYTTDNHHGEKR